MKIAKEYRKNRTNEKYLVSIYTNSFRNDLAYFEELVAVAKADFSYLENKDIEIVRSPEDGGRWSYGIEFFVSKVPKGYKFLG